MVPNRHPFCEHFAERAMRKHASPRRKCRRMGDRRRPRLLSAQTKRAFFDEMDAFLTSGRRAGDAPRRERSPTVMTHRPENQAESHEPMGRDAKRETIELASISSSDDAPQKTTTRPVLPPTVMKRQLPATATRSSTPPEQKKPKHGKQRASTSFDPQDLVLRGKRVVLVPIGSDVSRKRLEIWREMVLAVGGEVVSYERTTPQKTQHQHAQLLHLHTTTKQANREPPRCEAFDWGQVDIVVVSVQVDAARLKQHFRMGEMPLPPHLQLVTPEWLAYVRHEKKLPADEKHFMWSHEIARVQQANEENERQAQVPRDADDAAYESGGDGDGSDQKNLTSKEIVRAPPVQVDMDKIRREEEELQQKKEKLVNERIPIFHQLNPRFETISKASEAHKMKTEAFVCQKSSLMQANLNAHLTDPLEELMEFLHVERDIWREYSYKKIVSSLKAMRTRVSSVRDLKGLWWAKGRMRDKVVEILETGKLEKLEAKKTNPRLRTLVEMSRIWGVGPATAAKLYNQGYKTMDALRKNSDEVLNFQQQIGLKHYQDFMTKIPRSEVQEIEKTVVDEIHRLVPNATALACGSYRRGKPSSGDVDVLITDPDSEECDILPELLRRLHEMNFLTDDLTHVSDHHMGRCDSYMGVCRLREGLPFRRIDIKVYPRRYFGFALLYFTGSDHFNRSMRLFARKKGWSLSDRYLKRVVRVRKDVKIESGESVVCPEEVDVFIALGLEYKDPTERNCFDIRFLEEDEAQAKQRKGSGGEPATAQTTTMVDDT